MILMGWWMSDAIVQPDTQALAYRVFQDSQVDRFRSWR